MTSPRIAIVGIGNVGWNLGFRLHEAGYKVALLISESHNASDDLAKELGAEVKDHPSQVDEKIDLAILCVPDDVIQRTAESISPTVAVVHTSGSTPMLNDRQKSGVLYPFQTFSKHVRPDWKGIPVLVESNHAELEELLLKIGRDLSGNVEVKSSDQRKIVHMSGVFGANFVNHILYLAERVLAKGDTSFEVLEPLLHETLRKAIEYSPEASQTGPARRGDESMISKHLEQLKDDPCTQEIYRLLSESIQKTYRP